MTAKNRIAKPLIEAIADRMVYGSDTTWAMNIHSFDWVPGVGLYGIYQAYEKTGKQAYLDFLEQWAARHLKEAGAHRTINSSAPLLTIFELYQITKKNEYLQACVEGAQYLVNDAPLTREGGLEHTVTEAVEGFREQLWADTLFMACIFLAKMGSVDGKYLDFALNQLKIHHAHLFDEQTGLCFHGWNCEAQNHMSAVYWGRANAWVLYSTMAILNIVGDFAGRKEIEANIQKHVSALKQIQRSDGGFSTVLNHMDSYVEISATAGIAAGAKLAYDAGIVGADGMELYARAKDAVSAAVAPDGVVTGVSSGTPVMKTVEEYKQIEIRPTLYGQGLAILCLALD